MWIKIVIVFLLLSILVSLFMALFNLVRAPVSSKKTVKSLTYRIILSLLLFCVFIIAAMTGFLPMDNQPL